MLNAILTFVMSYIRVLIFAVAVLLGVQVPGFISQYELTVNAHLSEAKLNVSGFQSTADRYFQGSLSSLIAYYKNSQDQVFREDATNIQNIVQRVAFLESEASMFERSEAFILLKLLSEYQSPLVKETMQAYLWVVPLNMNAIFWGLACGLTLTLMLDLLYFLVRTLWRNILRRKKHQLV